MSEFVLYIKDIDDVGKDYSFVLRAEWMRSALAGTDLRPSPHGPPGRFDFRAQLNGEADDEILITGSLRAWLETDCVRCLTPVALDVDTPFTALMVPEGRRSLPTELELDADDLDTVTFRGDRIEFDDMLREQLVVEAPMQPRCAVPCEMLEVPERLRPPDDVFGGQSPSSEAVDPRFAPLLELKNKLPSRKE